MNKIYIVTGIMFTLLLILVFKIKKQNNLLSNSTYFILTLTLIVGYILELIIYYLNSISINNIILEIYTKLYLIFIICWSSIFSVYIFLLSKKDDEYNKKIMILYALLTLTSSIAVIILPLNITYTNRIILSGNSINFLKILILCMLSILYMRIILNNKIVKTMKADYIYIVLIILTISYFLETSILVANFLIAL